MNLTANRKTLLDALQSVAVASQAKTANPYSNFVLLTCAGGRLSIVTDSIALRAEASIECHMKSPGVALVSYTKLVNPLQRDDFAEANLSLENDRLLVRLGSGPGGSLPTMAADAFPKARDEAGQLAFVVLDGKTFGYAVAVAAQCAGDGVAHAWNTSLLIQDDGKDLTMFGSDGKQVARIKLPSSESTFRSIVPAKLMRALVSAFTESESLAMQVYERGLKFACDDITYSVQGADTGYNGSIFQIADSLDVGNKHSVVVNREHLISVAQTASYQLEEGELDLLLEVSTNPQALVVRSKSRRTSAQWEESIDTKATAPLEEHRVNHRQIIPQLRSLDCENVALCYDPEDKQPAYRMTPEGMSSVSLYAVYMRI